MAKPHQIDSNTRLVLRPHRPGRTRWLILAAVALWVLTLAATWVLASYRAAPGLLDMQHRLSRAEGELAEALAERERAERQLSISERSDQVSRSASEALQSDLKAREDEIAALRADLAFYQRLMGGKAPRQGLTVQQVAVRQLGGDNGYALRATLTQNLRKGEVTSGNAEFRLEGMLQGKLSTLAWSDLAERKPAEATAFSFKYFQELDVSFVLPQGFTPSQVVLVVKSAQGDSLERKFPWDQAITAGEDQNVWK